MSLSIADLRIAHAYIDGGGNPEAPDQIPVVRIHIKRPCPMAEMSIDEARELIDSLEFAITEAECGPDDDEAFGRDTTLEARLDRVMRDEP